ncbi:MAG: transposase [Oscillospiraceae bacterium]|nr:transposase [Oscillospiraceae bacterium]
MTNFNTLTHNLKRGFLNFSEKVTKNLSRPDFKFTSQMIYGIFCSQSCHLSKVARALNEDIKLKKTIDRLSRNLNDFDNGDILTENYLETVKTQINDKTILIVDGSDITKTYTTKMEGISKVRDGSTGEYKLGYHTLGITALTPERKMPIPVYTKVYTPKEEGFISEDDEVLKGLKFLGEHFSKKNIRAFDRGYDNNTYYEYLIKNNEKFIIRARKNRDVIYDGKRINILELAKRFKGKYKLDFKKKNGVNITCKISIIPIKLVCKPNDKLNLVVCYGFGKEPMLLITNLKSEDKRLSVAIVKVYLMRWRIEEYYRFKKNQFKFEDLRVRSLNSIRNLDLILMIVVGYIGYISEKQEEKPYVMELIKISKRIYDIANFVFYAIADGLFVVLSKGKSGIGDMLKKKQKSPQLTFFKDDGFCWL